MNIFVLIIFSVLAGFALVGIGLLIATDLGFFDPDDF